MKKLKIDSICVKENRQIENGDAHILPINASSAFSYKTIEDSIDVFTGQKKGFVYGRYGNPTIASVETKIAELEGIDLDQPCFCTLTSSGMSAISTLLLSQIKPGENILTQSNLYGGTTELLKSILEPLGIGILYTDLNNSKKLQSILESHDNIGLIYFETPNNPTLDCIDIAQVVELAKSHSVHTAIDNTFSTAYLQRPMHLGVDFVVYSTTKFLNGHGNSIAGAIISIDEIKQQAIWNTMKLMGTNCNAFDAWLLHNGLKTLALRMDRHCSNALSLARYLQKHERVNKVNYPGLEENKNHLIAKKQMSQFGAMLSFELIGGIEAAKNFMNNCELCTIASTLGNTDTLLLHPATSSHLKVDKDLRIQNGITDGLIRVSVGIENIEDLIADIEQSLARVKK